MAYLDVLTSEVLGKGVINRLSSVTVVSGLRVHRGILENAFSIKNSGPLEIRTAGEVLESK